MFVILDAGVPQEIKINLGVTNGNEFDDGLVDFVNEVGTEEGIFTCSGEIFAHNFHNIHIQMFILMRLWLWKIIFWFETNKLINIHENTPVYAS